LSRAILDVGQIAGSRPVQKNPTPGGTGHSIRRRFALRGFQESDLWVYHDRRAQVLWRSRLLEMTPHSRSMSLVSKRTPPVPSGYGRTSKPGCVRKGAVRRHASSQVGSAAKRGDSGRKSMGWCSDFAVMGVHTSPAVSAPMGPKTGPWQPVLLVRPNSSGSAGLASVTSVVHSLCPLVIALSRRAWADQSLHACCCRASLPVGVISGSEVTRQPIGTQLAADQAQGD